MDRRHFSTVDLFFLLLQTKKKKKKQNNIKCLYIQKTF